MYLEYFDTDLWVICIASQIECCIMHSDGDAAEFVLDFSSLQYWRQLCAFYYPSFIKKVSRQQTAKTATTDR